MAGRLIVISNRIPTEAEPAGGLVFALHEALRRKGGVWVGTNPNVVDDPSDKLTEHDVSTSYRRMGFDITQDEYDAFYLGFANSVLWPICHRRGDLVSLSKQSEAGYFAVNRRLAQQVAQIVEPDDVIWVHDYHFFPLATELRECGVENRIGFFLHVPFPALGDLGALPQRANMAQWLANYDLVGLQTKADVARCLEMFRAETRAEMMLDGSVRLGGRVFSVRSFPIGIDVEAFGEAARSTALPPAVTATLPTDLLIGVDRLDYSKGLPNRFRAYARYLDNREDPEHRASLLQIAPPSRQEVQAYRDLRMELEELTGWVNGTHAELDWTPLRYIHRNIDRGTLAALYRRAKVALVTPFADGMNLVAKEFVAAQDVRDPGVLILSHMAGAAEDLTEALLVNPYDIDEMAEAIETALTMSLAERRQRHAHAMEKVTATDVSIWCESYLDALLAIKPRSETPVGLKLQQLALL